MRTVPGEWAPKPRKPVERFPFWPQGPANIAVDPARMRGYHGRGSNHAEGQGTVTTIPAGKDPVTGRFTAGNRWWEARSSHGRNPVFETADDLKAACLEYFEWNESNPLYKDQLVTFQGSATHEPVAQMRAMSLHGLCMFLDISRGLWNQWRTTRPDFLEVIEMVEGAIFRQKFEGASADLLNASIIARDLGLADKKEHTSPDGSMTPKPAIDASKLSTEALRELMGLMDGEIPETDGG